VLVAEDDEGLGEVLVRGLREQGYVVDLVPDGETAAAYLRFYSYEVAVLDWRMPRLSGLDLVRRLRRGDTATARETLVSGYRPSLTATELGILEILMRRYPGVADRRSIALHVWDNEADAYGSNTIDVHLARLRSKLAGAGARIETVRGVGYRIVAS
jgi:DNA-binding response OmpR family regulator